MINQKCKGARDLLPDDIDRFRYVQSAFTESCVQWGYQEVKTPTLEYLHLFTSSGTLSTSMLNRVYSFLDWDGWSGERVVLRPDGTIPVVRLYNENLSDQRSARLFYITSVFAFEETGIENREQWQCGVELIGNPSLPSDLEVLLLGLEILTALNIGEVKVQLSHAGLLRALIDDLHLDAEAQGRLLTEIREGNWDSLKTAGNTEDMDSIINALFNIKGNSSGFLHNLGALPHTSHVFQKQLANFIELTTVLDAISYNYEIDMTSSRDFEYYTGLCFQFSVRNLKAGGGGRYDDLIPLMGGKETPACGFALYADSLINMISLPNNIVASTNVSIIRGKNPRLQIIRRSYKLAQKIHDAGYRAEIDWHDCCERGRFVITIEGKAPHYSVFDKQTGKTASVSSENGVLRIIGGPALERSKKAARKAN